MKLSYLALAAGLLAAAPATAQVTASASDANAAANGADATFKNNYNTVTYFNNFSTTSPLFPGLDYQTGNNGTTSAAPFGDTTQYGYISTDNTPITFNTSSLGSFNQVSFLWGSIDPYNTVSFLAGSTVVGSFTGTSIDAGAAAAVATRYVTFQIAPSLVGKITGISFSSPQAAFEIDDLAVGNAVPEAATWAMMMVGLGVAGASLRRRKASVRYAAA